tara:strand:+ start:739 stop:1260 length:522 start_codon:yes stop_codon:yes gene_type:complete
MAVTFKPVADFGEFSQPLRNIRAYLNDDCLVLDLVPRAKEPVRFPVDEDAPEYMKVILGDAPREIVESDRFLRLEFSAVWGWMVHEEFAENVAFSLPLADWPKVPGAKHGYPIVEVIGSPWRAQVPDYQRGDNPDLCHFSIRSMTTYMDVIGWRPEGRWLDASSTPKIELRTP